MSDVDLQDQISQLLPPSVSSILEHREDGPTLGFKSRVEDIANLIGNDDLLWRWVCRCDGLDITTAAALEALEEIRAYLDYHNTRKRKYPSNWALLNSHHGAAILPKDQADPRYCSVGHRNPKFELDRAHEKIRQDCCGQLGSAGLTYPFKPDRLYDVDEDRVVHVPTELSNQQFIDYWCVSHVWGPAQVQADLQPPQGVQWSFPIRDTEKWITLQSLMRRSGVRYWWIDIACINQDDENDKNSQVSVMGNIYANAMGTLVYEESLTKSLLEPIVEVHAFMESCTNYTQCQLYENNQQPNRQVESMIKTMELCLTLALAGYLSASEWETRVWTLQEKMLSVKLVAAVSLDQGYLLFDLRVIMNNIMSSQTPFPVGQYQRMRDSIKPVQPTTKSNFNAAFSMGNILTQWSVWARSLFRAAIPPNFALRWLSSRTCSVPQDKIYGAQWLLAVKMEVDYSGGLDAAWREVYAQSQQGTASNPAFVIGCPRHLVAKDGSERKGQKWVPNARIDFSLPMTSAMQPMYDSVEVTKEGLHYKNVAVIPLGGKRDRAKAKWGLASPLLEFSVKRHRMPEHKWVDLSKLPAMKPLQHIPAYQFEPFEVPDNPEYSMHLQLESLAEHFGIMQPRIWATIVTRLLSDIGYFLRNCDSPFDSMPFPVQFSVVTYFFLSGLVLASSDNKNLVGKHRDVILGQLLYALHPVMSMYADKLHRVGLYPKLAEMIYFTGRSVMPNMRAKSVFDLYPFWRIEVTADSGKVGYAELTMTKKMEDTLTWIEKGEDCEDDCVAVLPGCVGGSNMGFLPLGMRQELRTGWLCRVVGTSFGTNNVSSSEPQLVVEPLAGLAVVGHFDASKMCHVLVE